MKFNKKQAQLLVGTVAMASAVASVAVSIYVVGKSISVLRKMGKALDIYIDEHTGSARFDRGPKDWQDADEEDSLSF